MSTIRVDTLTGSDGTSPVTLTKQSAAKAWANFDGTGTVSVRDDLNISTLTDNGTGDYTATLTSALANANGSYVFGCMTNSGSGDVRGVNNVPPTTTSIRFYGLSGSQAALQDLDYIWMQVNGDLA